MQSVSWIGYLKRHQLDPGVSLLLQIGGDYPSRTEARIKKELLRDRIDEDIYLHRMDVLTEWRARFGESMPVVDERDPEDWTEITPGGFMRENHLGDVDEE